MELKKSEDYLPILSPIIERINQEMKKEFPGFQFEHVGSTSIPGAITKGDLDFVLIVKPEEFQITQSKLENLSYYIKDDTLQTDELRMMVTDKYQHDVAIQIVIKGSRFESFLFFRDLLRNDHELVKRYNKIKTKSVGESYRQNKASFISDVLAKL